MPLGVSRRLRLLLVAAALTIPAGGLAFAGLRHLYNASLIKPLLPGPGSFACFTGTFDKASVDIEDWSKQKRVPTGETRPDGSAASIITFDRARDVPATRFTLRLDYDDRTADYDWIYNFTLVGNVKGYGELHARGECPWYDKDTVDTGLGRMPAGTFKLGCGIDCDGGSMSVTRVTGTGALALDFSEYGLRMKLGCGGGGVFNVRPNARGQTFKLMPAPQSACRDFDRLE